VRRFLDDEKAIDEDELDDDDAALAREAEATDATDADDLDDDLDEDEDDLDEDEDDEDDEDEDEDLDDEDEDADSADEDDEDAEDQDGEDAEDQDGKDAEDEDAEDEDAEDEDAEDEETTEEAAAEAKSEEIPVFLSTRGQLVLFRSREGLVDFVRSGAEHDLSQLSTWPELVEKITAADVVPTEEDRYELDLVVENLRGGYDAWDPELLIQAGEIARDIGYGLRLEPVQAALAPGSPLDDLDEAMRGAAGGGLSGFLARRKLKKIGAEAAPLGWRTIIGKISAVVDWRD
jgi:hypothetical protein